MSVKLVETEIRRFLSSEQPEVICISGKWGVGKTFAWNRFLRDAQGAKDLKLKKYSYVSLFGLSSLEEFKHADFENSLQRSEVGLKPNLKTPRTNTAAVAETLGRHAFRFVEN